MTWTERRLNFDAHFPTFPPAPFTSAYNTSQTQTGLETCPQAGKCFFFQPNCSKTKNCNPRHPTFITIMIIAPQKKALRNSGYNVWVFQWYFILYRQGNHTGGTELPLHLDRGWFYLLSLTKNCL